MSHRGLTFGWIAWALTGCSGWEQSGAPPVPVVSSPVRPVTAIPVSGKRAVPGLAVAVAAGPREGPGLRVDRGSATIGLEDAGLQLIATWFGLRGGRRDVTCCVRWTVEPAAAATVDAGGYLRPLAPGQASVRASLGSDQATLGVTIRPSTDRVWDFAEDIVPILTRGGCNVGGCHGRADGQNGFHLSLFGYDPQGDYLAITHDLGGRRVTRIAPEQSLLLGKVTGRVAHGGGQRFRVGSPEYRTLLAWVKDGAPATRGKAHGPLRSLAVEPGDIRLDEPGTQQLVVVARYADGSERDVTRMASFRGGDDSVVSITPEGRATLLRRAEADLVVRYQAQVVSARLATIVNPDLAFDFSKLRRRNFIDDELFKRLESLRVPPSPPASDAAFLRRVSHDLTGLQPPPDEVRRFLADTNPEKRIEVVDRLMASREFVLFWKIKLGDLLQVTSARFGNGSSYYHAWLEERLYENTPWDRTVHTLLTALGNPMARGGGPVNYALDAPDAKAAAEQTAQRFLGLRIRCAQCHDHPFDVWTQDDYFGLAAFFAKVQRPAPIACGDPMPKRSEVRLDPNGTVEHLRTRKPAAPRLLDGRVVTVNDGDDPRKALADWITAPDNPFFARATANWVWAQFFGKGLADPPDDLSRSNPPVHPALLDALARHFVTHKFDLKDLIRTVATSETYGLSSGTVPGNEKDRRLFSHHVPRPLSPHQMADALAQATDVPNRFPNKPAHTRAIEVYDPATSSTILDTFGRCNRTTACAAVATPPLSLRQSLLLIGGDVIESKVSSLNGYLTGLLELSPAPDEVVENLYLRVLCRLPTPVEQLRWSAELKQATSLREASEDLFWALLNSREFAFNH
jgi:hypothetical protein